MSTTVSISGSSYTVSNEGDANWGASTTDLLIALATSTKILQTTSSSFPLSTDVDFGSNYGLKLQYIKSRASNPSSSGIIRLGNTESIGFRNAANNADLNLSVNNLNQLTYNGAVLSSATGPAFDDSLTVFFNSVDNTKKLSFDLSNISTGTTRTLSFPDLDDTLVSKTSVDTLLNKTIDASLNPITNIPATSLTGIIDTDLSSVSLLDDTIPSAKATKTYVDVVDTKISNHLSDTTDAHDASAISFAATGTLLATDVQAALIELESEIVAASGAAGTVQTNLTTHINNTTDAHDASAISNIPSGNLAATDIQAAVNELQGDIDTNATNLTNHLNDTVDAHDASAISSVASGNLAATDVQGALNELQSDIDLRVLTTGGSVISPLRLDVKKDTKANLDTYALTAANGQFVFATDTKEMLQVIDTLLVEVGAGGGGIASVDILSAEIADDAVLADFTQTGLEILDTPIVLHGTKSFRLQHATSIKSFKKVIFVDRKFRGKNNTISLDVVSTATNANLNIIFRDETNSINLTTSQAIATGSQAITATTANASNQLTGMTNTVLNTLKVGMVITGSAIPVGTTITAISSTAATMSQNATGVSTGIRISALVEKKTFSVDIPNNCQSFSWVISSVVEAATESYIDDVVVQLTSAALTSTSIIVPRTVATKSYVPTFTGFGTPTNVEFEYDEDGEYYNIRGKFTSGTPTAVEARISLPNGATSGNTTLIPSLAVIGKGNSNATSAAAFSGIAVLIEPSVTYMTLASENSTNSGLTKSNGNILTVNGTLVSFFARVPIANAAATESKTIPLTSSQLVQTPDSYLQMNGFAASLASTANKIFTLSSNTIVSNIGNAIQYTVDAVNGDRFTALVDGDYSFSVSAQVAQDTSFSLSKNSTALTTSYAAIPVAEKLISGVTPGAGLYASFSWRGRLVAGDIVRLHNNNTAITANGANSISVSQTGSLKQLNFSTDSKITIPTHQLRFEGASSRGATDTAIVKFDTQAITQGDAWDVVNSAANGTVVTMKKAGKLSVSTVVTPANNSTVVISKNQSGLTTIPTNSEAVTTHTNNANYFTNLTALIDVVVGDKIRVASNATTLTAQPSNNLTLSLTESSIPANFSNVLPQWSQSDSSVRLNTANGYGSTNTAIRRFSNNIENLGSSITYSDSATLGASFTINEDGIYNISYCDNFNTTAHLGISKNSSQLTTNIISINVADRLSGVITSANSFTTEASWSGFLSKNDVIRPHTEGVAGGTADRVSFTISKVGKPNLSSVDVTSFVNMKTTDVQSIRMSNLSASAPATDTAILHFINTDSNTNNGILRIDSDATFGTRITALKDCTIVGNYNASFTTSQDMGWSLNSTQLTSALNTITVANRKSITRGTASAPQTVPVECQLKAGDILRPHVAGVTRAGTPTDFFLDITATADNNATASPTQQVSSDTMSFAFKATAIDPATDAIGTFNTYTYAINSNVPTISASAPTQTISSMNIDGIRVFTRIYAAASTTASPARVEIFIGKGLKSTSLNLYKSAAKTIMGSMDHVIQSSAEIAGFTWKDYNETTGILTLDAGRSQIATEVSRFCVFNDQTQQTSGYVVFNASKSPSLVTIPSLQQRVAYLSDVKASGTNGGSTSAATTHTRTLNTIVDPTGIVTSLASNQFVLPAGTYEIEASAPAYIVNAHRIRIRNITDSTTSILGQAAYSDSANAGYSHSFCAGQFTIYSSKTFELQHYTESAAGTNGFGVRSNTGESEVFSICKITRIK